MIALTLFAILIFLITVMWSIIGMCWFLSIKLTENFFINTFIMFVSGPLLWFFTGLYIIQLINNWIKERVFE
jgi:hypothetical protein